VARACGVAMYAAEAWWPGTTRVSASRTTKVWTQGEVSAAAAYQAAGPNPPHRHGRVEIRRAAGLVVGRKVP